MSTPGKMEMETIGCMRQNACRLVISPRTSCASISASGFALPSSNTCSRKVAGIGLADLVMEMLTTFLMSAINPPVSLKNSQKLGSLFSNPWSNRETLCQNGCPCPVIGKYLQVRCICYCVCVSLNKVLRAGCRNTDNPRNCAFGHRRIFIRDYFDQVSFARFKICSPQGHYVLLLCAHPYWSPRWGGQQRFMFWTQKSRGLNIL